jgi:hypothetical protein
LCRFDGRAGIVLLGPAQAVGNFGSVVGAVSSDLPAAGRAGEKLTGLRKRIPLENSFLEKYVLSMYTHSAASVLIGFAAAAGGKPN